MEGRERRPSDGVERRLSSPSDGGCMVTEKDECSRICVCFYILEVVVGWCVLVWPRSDS